MGNTSDSPTGAPTLSHLLGLKVVSSPYAREIRDEYRVERVPIPKRRRRWRVVKHHIDRPCAYILTGGTAVLHPELLAALRNIERDRP